MEFLSSKGFKCFLLTFEGIVSDGSIKIESRFNNKIEFSKIFILHDIFPDWLKMIIKGTVKTIKLMNNNSIGILHARSFTPALISLIIKILYGTNIRFIYDNRGLFIEEQVYTGKWSENSLKVKISRKLEYLILKNSDKIIVVSDQFRNYLSEKYNKLFDHKITVIRNRTVITPIKYKDDIKQNKKVTGIFSGSGARWQNIPELNNMIKTASEVFPDIEFKIFTYRDAYQHSENDPINLSTNVKLYNLEPAEVKKEMLTGDFGILLRQKVQLNKVSSPLKFSEYLSCGLPIILSEGIGDTEEIINKYGVGVIIRDKDYIDALTRLQELLKNSDIKKKCHLVAEIEFNIVDSFNEYNRVYKEIISD